MGGPEGNARLTGTVAAILLLLLAAEGVTVLSIHSLLTPHVFIGMLLVPPVAVKMGSTGYRFVRYYTGAPEYRRKGPPPALLRVLGPIIVLLTILLFASGIGLLFVGAGPRRDFLVVHKASFVLWFGAMIVHVLGHLLDTARLAPGDFYWRTRKQVGGQVCASGQLPPAWRWALCCACSSSAKLAISSPVSTSVNPWPDGSGWSHPGRGHRTRQGC
jgi:hypothetical protein